MSTVEKLAATPGASDQDRNAWLAERRTGITATEIRDLYMGKVTPGRLIALKLGREKDTFRGNAFTRWGNERESFIAAQALERFGLAPESRVFHAVDEPRFLASPDGLGENFDGDVEIAEYKTAGVDIAPGTTHYEEKGYFIQKVWAMRVMGARRCLYGAEDRITVPGGFEPGGLRFWWIEWDAAAESLAMRLEDLAHVFLAALDDAAAEEWEQPEVDDELDTLAVNYLRFLGEEKSAGVAKTAAFNAVKKALADRDRFQQETMLARITWTRGGETTSTERVERLSVDEEAAKSAHPAEWEALQKTAAALQKAEAAEERARARFEKAEGQWISLLPDHTKSEFVEEQVTTTTRANLTITAPKIKETKK